MTQADTVTAVRMSLDSTKPTGPEQASNDSPRRWASCCKCGEGTSSPVLHSVVPMSSGFTIFVYVCGGCL